MPAPIVHRSIHCVDRGHACRNGALGRVAGEYSTPHPERVRVRQPSVHRGDTDPTNRFEHVVVVQRLERFAKE